MASVSSYRFSADSAACSAVVPKRAAVRCAAIEITLASISTNLVNAGIMMSIKGCANVSSAPFKRAIAARASSFVLMTFPIHSRNFASACEMMVKISALLMTSRRRMENLLALFCALSTDFAIFSADGPALAIFCWIPPASAFALFSLASRPEILES